MAIKPTEVVDVACIFTYPSVGVVAVSTSCQVEGSVTLGVSDIDASSGIAL